LGILGEPEQAVTPRFPLGASNPLLLEVDLHLLEPPPHPGSIFRKAAVVLQAVMVIPIPQA